MARTIDCPCGHTLTGKDDGELFAMAKQHVREHHTDSTRSEDEIRQLVAQMARDA
jgi:predicted small metal-binding protein